MAIGQNKSEVGPISQNARCCTARSYGKRYNILKAKDEKYETGCFKVKLNCTSNNNKKVTLT